MKREIWKDIKGYEGEYQISNFGRVISFKGKTPRILKLNKDGEDYFNVNLSKNGKQKIFKIHLLVWDYFGYDKRDGRKIVVDHIIEKDKFNNHIDNLQLLTHRRNIIKSNVSKECRGTSWHKNNKRWVAQITYNGKKIFLGSFDNEYDAHLAYKKGLLKYD